MKYPHEQQRGHQHHGRIQTNQPGIHSQRVNHSRNTKNSANIEYIGSHHVPHGNPRITFQRGLHADQQLRRTCPESHHGQTDN